MYKWNHFVFKDNDFTIKILVPISAYLVYIIIICTSTSNKQMIFECFSRENLIPKNNN